MSGDSDGTRPSQAIAGGGLATRSVGPIWFVAIFVLIVMGLGVGGASYYLPRAIEAGAIESAYRSSLETADQIKIARGYYTQHVVAKALKTDQLTVTNMHMGVANAIPIPATFVKDISDLLAKRETSLSLLSPYPWPHRAERKLDDFENAAWNAFQVDPHQVFSRQEVKNGQRVLRVAVADRMTSQTCVDCHNQHPQSVKRDWKIGDVRAVMEVTKVTEPLLTLAHERSRTIVVGLAAIAILAAVALLVVTWLVDKRTRGQNHAVAEQARLLAASEELRAARHAAEGANRAKSQFLAMMSHEIRTPMNAVIGLSSSLVGQNLDAGQQRLAETIHESSLSLLRLLDDILDISKLEADQIAFENAPFQPASIMRDITVIFGQRIAEKGLALSVDIDERVPAWVSGDAVRIRQVLFNLLSNACKFTEKGAIAVGLSVRCIEGSTAHVEFAVRDSGIGLTEDQQKDLFRSFKQADSTINRRFGGSGLGLAISKRLADQMGGCIGVVSQIGVGSTFTVALSLPVVEAPAATAPQVRDASRSPTAANNDPAGPSPEGTEASAGDASAAPLRILLAEDNKTNRLVFQSLLEKEAVDITIAVNGRDALEQTMATEFDLIFMDVQMPEMDGLEATRRIRRLDGDRGRVAIVALTANAYPEDVASCYAAGMDEFLAKPIRKQVLVDTVRAYAARGDAGRRHVGDLVKAV